MNPPPGAVAGNLIHAVRQGVVVLGRQRSRRGALNELSDFFLGHDLALDHRQQGFKHGKHVGSKPACHKQKHDRVTDLQVPGIDPGFYFYNSGFLL